MNQSFFQQQQPKQQNRFRMAVINQQQDHSPPSGPLSPADYYSSADEDDVI